MQYVIKLLPKEGKKFSSYWTGSDWAEVIDDACHYNRREDAVEEVRTIGEDEMFEPATHNVTIEERS